MTNPRSDIPKDNKALPCPICEYDLRGQLTPRCPECGQKFDSLDVLARASASAERIINRLLTWRTRVAWVFLSSIFISVIIEYVAPPLDTPLPQQPATIVFLFAMFTMLASSLSAFILLL